MNNGQKRDMVTRAVVPIIGEKAWVCKNEHKYMAPVAWRYVLQIALGQAVTSGPMCPLCFLNWAAFACPSWPEGMAMSEAVEQGLLNPVVLGELA